MRRTSRLHQATEPQALEQRDVMLTPDGVCELLEISRGTLAKWMARPDGFPPPDVNQANTLRWRRSTIERWIDESGNPNGLHRGIVPMTRLIPGRHERDQA